ncbi:serine/threonine-protein kinase [Streptomyces violens]|uniref:serine/threonine-protein kinase n=1 Tax=Streptomyces violens TaxID=66377 RepID=UPI0012FF2648|nr:serine/threonine-protein kinase [Streptomyces violens]
MEQGTGPGRVLGGRYRLEIQQGYGGYGQVWVAYDESLHVRVAAEALGAVDSTRVRRFALAVARLRGHPNLVPVYDVVEARGVVWRIRALVPGPSLADPAAHGPMPAEMVWEVAQALLNALAAMHEAGIVHGDVRPANVVQTEGRWALLPGTGAVERIDGTWPTGSANYVAPEVLLGARPAPSSDLFSLGSTLYHLLAGHPPFQRHSIAETLLAVAQADPPPLSLHAGELAPLVEGLLAKEPDRRLTTTQALGVLDRAGRKLSGRKRYREEAAQARAGAALRGRRSHTAGAASLFGIPVLLAAALMWAAAQAEVRPGDISDFFVVLLPWAVFAVGLCVLVVQARAALTRRRARERVSVWRCYVRSLAPPARWTDEERARRRAAAERAVDEALLTVDRRVASASPRAGRGATDA